MWRICCRRMSFWRKFCSKFLFLFSFLLLFLLLLCCLCLSFFSLLEFAFIIIIIVVFCLPFERLKTTICLFFGMGWSLIAKVTFCFCVVVMIIYEEPGVLLLPTADCYAAYSISN